MAATLDATLGTKAQAGSVTASLVTTAAAAANTLIVFGVGFFRLGGATASVTTTGGLTWANTSPTVSGSIHDYLFYAFAPAGLASGTTITWTASAGTPDWLIGGASFLGMDSTPTLLASNGAAISAATWSTGSMAAGETNLGVAAVFEDGNGTLTWTTTAPATELIDFNSAGQTEAFTLGYDLANAATATIAGTASASVSNVARGAAFKIAGGAAAAPNIYIPQDLWEDHGPGEFGPNPFYADDPTVLTGTPVVPPATTRRRRTLKGAGH